MPDLRPILLSQFEAALAMLKKCLEACPAEHWDTPIVKYPLWQVAYHTLCFVDCYLSPSDAEFRPRPEIHPRGLAELADEYPSRRFSREELLAYTDWCRHRAREVLASETDDILSGPSGFPRLPFSRAERHLYNLRHIQHHAGQLSALLRRHGIDTPWIGRGWH